MYITMKLILNMIFCLIIKIYTNFNMINKSIKNVNKRTYCEAQGKGRAKGHSKVIYRWWMVDILSLMLYIKFGCHPPTFLPPEVS